MEIFDALKQGLTVTACSIERPEVVFTITPEQDGDGAWRFFSLLENGNPVSGDQHRFLDPLMRPRHFTGVEVIEMVATEKEDKS